MKKVFSISVLCILLALPFVGVGQTIVHNSGGTSSGGGTFYTSGAIPNYVLNQVLTIAAPYFGFPAGDFIAMYQNCGCISVEQVGPSTYFVTYGGLGIQIIIDGGRSSGPGNNSQPSGTKR